MKKYSVDILSLDNQELLTTYVIEEENKTIAQLRARGRFRKEFEAYSKVNIRAVAKVSTRNIVNVQSPKKWEFI